MKKTIFISAAISLIVIGGLYWYIQHQKATNLETICRTSGDGWAPYWGQKDCNGNELSADSELVDDEGFTCYCHAENTCWDGKSCIPIPVSKISDESPIEDTSANTVNESMQKIDPVKDVEQPVTTFENLLDKLDVYAAAVIPSSEIDESPRWSPDSQSVAVNMPSGWHVLDLNSINLEEGNWQNIRIGVNTKNSLQLISEETVEDWKSSDEAESVVSLSGDKFQIEPKELFGVVISINNKKLWETDLELCYHVTLSPDSKKVLFKCESNGVFIFDFEKYRTK